MERRSDLLLQELRDLLGTDEVYFQSASNAGIDDEPFIITGIQYPCFIVERTTAYQPKANDKTYLFRPGYQVTYINRDEPDPEMLEAVSQHFVCCNYQKHFVQDNLHHDVFMIFY